MKSKILSEVDHKHEIYFTADDYNRIYRKYDSFLASREDNPYVQLLCAKACFFKAQYQECLKALKEIRPDHSTKILYEKQALMIKTLYLLEPENSKQLEK